MISKLAPERSYYAEFLSRFSKISPHEAKSMDSQHRIPLNTAYEALEDSGYVPADIELDIFPGALLQEPDLGLLSSMLKYLFQVLPYLLDLLIVPKVLRFLFSKAMI
ncbi:hypothetical protein H2248_007005 [Termitomyces sp. 'cryptogamus']|nr:hypothetical protein H2248_007005 [Termitomyces sp. 'cryptogamus']